MTHYRAASPEALQIVSLDELTLLYHRPSGTTHLLAEPAPQIIAALQERESDLSGLLGSFGLDEERGPILLERLEELVAAGLVVAT